MGNLSVGHLQMVNLYTAHSTLRNCAQHTLIFDFCLQHTAAHKRTSLPLKNRAHPSALSLSSFLLPLRRSAQCCCTARHRPPLAVPQARRPGGQREDARREEEAAAGAVPTRCRSAGRRHLDSSAPAAGRTQGWERDREGAGAEGPTTKQGLRGHRAGPCSSAPRPPRRALLATAARRVVQAARGRHG